MEDQQLLPAIKSPLPDRKTRRRLDAAQVGGHAHTNEGFSTAVWVEPFGGHQRLARHAASGAQRWTVHLCCQARQATTVCHRHHGVPLTTRTSLGLAGAVGLLWLLAWSMWWLPTPELTQPVMPTRLQTSSLPVNGLREPPRIQSHALPQIWVSVGIDVDGSGLGLKSQLDSLLRQTMLPREVVLYAQHASVVKATTLCKALVAILCKVCPAEPGLDAAGRANALGLGLLQADVMVLLQPTEVLFPTAVEHAAWVLASRPSTAAVTGQVARQGVQTSGLVSPAALQHTVVHASAAFVRRSIFQQLGGLRPAASASVAWYGWWLRFFAAGYEHFYIPEPVSALPVEGLANATDYGLAVQAARQAVPSLFIPGALPEGNVPLDRDGFMPVNLARFAALPALRRPAAAACRILLLVPWFAVGGADAVNLHVMDALAARGCTLSLVGTTPEHVELLPEILAMTPDVHYLPHLLPEQYHVHFVHHMILTRAVTHVYTSNSDMALYMLPLLRLLHPSLPVVCLSHAVEPAWRHGGQVLHAALVAQHIQRFIVVGHALQAWLVRHGVSAECIATCNNGVKDELLQLERGQAAAQARAMWPALAQRLVIAIVGRIAVEKRPLLWVSVAQQLAGALPAGASFVIVVAGTGPMEQQLRDAIHRAGLEHAFIFTGLLTSPQTASLLAAANLSLQLSAHEGMSLAVMESLAVGTPVICTDVGEHNALVQPPRSGEAPAIQLVQADPAADVVPAAVASVLRAMSAPPQAEPMRQWMQQHFTVSKFKQCAARSIIQAPTPAGPAPDEWSAAKEAYRVGYTLEMLML